MEVQGPAPARRADERKASDLGTILPAERIDESKWSSVERKCHALWLRVTYVT